MYKANGKWLEEYDWLVIGNEPRLEKSGARLAQKLIVKRQRMVDNTIVDDLTQGATQ